MVAGFYEWHAWFNEVIRCHAYNHKILLGSKPTEKEYNLYTQIMDVLCVFHNNESFILRRECWEFY